MLHIKPSVLLLTSDPKSKLTNFGDIADNGNDIRNKTTTKSFKN